MGQPSLALPTAVWKVASSTPGTVARSFSTAEMTVNPASSLSAVMATLTSLAVTGKPALASSLLEAIEKQEAHAAARSSSGLVSPVSEASARACQLVASGPNVPVAGVTVPLPVGRSPSQWALAVLICAIGAPHRFGGALGDKACPAEARDGPGSGRMQ